MRIDLLPWRIPLIVLGAFVVLQGAAFWLLSTASQEAQTAREQLAWIKKQEDVVNWIRQKPDESAFNQSLAQAVTESAQRSGIVLLPVVSQGDTVQMTFASIEFNPLFSWLQQMQQTAGVVVISLELTPAASGEVNVSRLVLGRPPRVQ